MIKDHPLVSAVIPTYNSEQYIKETVDSVLSQTYPNVEVIIADGHSQDRTREIIEPYIKDGRIIFLYQRGKGPADARNCGMRAAHGEFITLLDSDDIAFPERIERQVKFFEEHPECDVCYCDIQHFYDDTPDQPLRLDYHYYSGQEVLPRLLERNFIAPSTVMLRRSVVERIGMFNEDYLRSEDWEYWVRLAYHGAMFEFLPKILIKYRLHRGSYSHGWKVKAAEKETSLRIFEELQREMSPDERRKYRIDAAILRLRLKLWAIYFGNYFPPVQWLYQWNQKRRLK